MIDSLAVSVFLVLNSPRLIFGVVHALFVVVAVLFTVITLGGLKRWLSRNTLSQYTSASAAHKPNGQACLKCEFADFETMQTGS